MLKKDIPCFAINVEKNTYRRDRVLAQREKSGLDIQLFKAITPNEIDQYPHRYSRDRALRFTGRELQKTELACALSHITLWRRLLDDPDHDCYLIMEDDVEIKTHLPSLIESLALAGPFVVKFTGKKQRPMRKIHALSEGLSLYLYAYGPLDLACYLINKEAARRLVPYCETIFTPVDIMMDRSYMHGVPIYGVFPYPVEAPIIYDPNNPIRSDIGVRNDDYKETRTVLSMISSRFYRVAGSVMRHMATLKLYLTAA
jgi:glycosyl transferase family 25